MVVTGSIDLFRPCPRRLALHSSTSHRQSTLLPLARSKCSRDYTSVMIVPTGIGAAIGGYAGDALPAARALSSVVDCLITHPNVLNAAMLYWPMPNVLYVEGYALDRFAEGRWALQPVHQNKIGLILDAGIEEDLRLRHLQVADAARASLGLNIGGYIVTDCPLEVEKWIDETTGQSSGRIKRPDSLKRAVHSLISRTHVTAVAVVARFPDDDFEDNYRLGLGVDPVAGAEAIISHFVVKEFQIPCAHAPATRPSSLLSAVVPKCAAEEIGYTFLPCVLAGLSKAPQYTAADVSSSNCIFSGDVDSVVLPHNACGGDGALAFARSLTNKVPEQPLVITVRENETVLHDSAERVGIEAVSVANYWEAIGVIAAHKAGVDMLSLRSNVKRVPNLVPNGIPSLSK